jgi:hypothetical protein
MPIRAAIKKYSAIDSKIRSRFKFETRIDTKEKIHEKVNKTAITQVNPSITFVSS